MREAVGLAARGGTGRSPRRSAPWGSSVLPEAGAFVGGATVSGMISGRGAGDPCERNAFRAIIDDRGDARSSGRSPRPIVRLQRSSEPGLPERGLMRTIRALYLPLLSAAGLSLMSASALAQTTASKAQDGQFSVQRFEPAPGTKNFLSVEVGCGRTNRSVNRGVRIGETRQLISASGDVGQGQRVSG